MPTVIENNGQLIWGRDAQCPECGEEWESFNAETPEGGIEICDECMERDHYEQP